MSSLHPRTPAQRLGLWLGSGLFLLLLWLPAPQGFSADAWRTGALTALMAVWWSTEGLPIPATPMVPLAASPLLSIVPVELGLCSRREADEFIAKGWVKVDGVVVDVLGSKVGPSAKITLDKQAQASQQQLATILLNKPIGYVSGQAEDGYEPAATLIQAASQWSGDARGRRFSSAILRGLAPAGRLDIDSTGLLVLTQDGRIARQLIGEDSGIEKEYLVRVSYGKVAANVRERRSPASIWLACGMV